MINVKESSRNLIILHMQPTKDDPLHHRCLWMTVYIDPVAWRLMVDSDCGAYTHCWPNEDDLHSFRKALPCYLMDEAYILSKISKRTVFDAEATMQNIEQSYCDDSELVETLREKLKGATTELEFSLLLYDDDVPGDLYECFDYAYPSEAVTVARLLKEHVAPVLRNGAPEGGEAE